LIGIIGKFIIYSLFILILFLLDRFFCLLKPVVKELEKFLAVNGRLLVGGYLYVDVRYVLLPL
jgi:hypothetical protein